MDTISRVIRSNYGVTVGISAGSTTLPAADTLLADSEEFVEELLSGAILSLYGLDLIDDFFDFATAVFPCSSGSREADRI